MTRSNAGSRSSLRVDESLETRGVAVISAVGLSTADGVETSGAGAIAGGGTSAFAGPGVN